MTARAAVLLMSSGGGGDGVFDDEKNDRRNTVDGLQKDPGVAKVVLRLEADSRCRYT